MLEYNVSIRHEGCWTERFNAAFPRVSASIVFSHPFADSSSTIIEVRNADEREVDDIVDWLGDHPVIAASELQQYASNQQTALISLQADYTDSETEPLMNVIRRHDCFPISSAEIKNGREHGTFLVSSTEQMKSLYTELSEYGPVTVKSLTELDITHPLSDLTEITQQITDLSPRQREVLLLAIREGYYDSPKQCSVDDLAELDDACMSTVAEHLRLAEMKLIQAMRPILENLGTQSVSSSSSPTASH